MNVGSKGLDIHRPLSGSNLVQRCESAVVFVLLDIHQGQKEVRVGEVRIRLQKSFEPRGGFFVAARQI